MPSVPIAQRMTDIAPFHVMELMDKARQLEQQGRSVIHMEVGEPDFPTPPLVIEAAQRYIAQGKVFYTSALGLSELREAIAQDYRIRFGVSVDPTRIVITSGASAALIMALGVLINPGDEILMADPGYPCNRHFARLFEGKAVPIPVQADTLYQPTAYQVEALWSAKTKGIMIASPANPTGTLIPAHDLAAIIKVAYLRGGNVIVDEIYQGLVYDQTATTALQHSQDIFVINSFSKYFGMTGWRLGWMVVPAEYVRAVEKLAQNLYISPPSPAQYAALAAFYPETLDELEKRRTAFRQRRDLLVDGLSHLGFGIPAKPGGAFYVYADITQHADDSSEFALELLDSTGVATTPGLDFGNNLPERHVRFAYTTGTEKLEEALQRLGIFISRR